uniref:Ycf21 n=1 Tax=Sebdenia flabellata TaxID=42024 RepID=A0A1C9C9W6_9FLOR|nr:hypothetical protein Sebd_094 [Sebdenia flabellata]AOM65181.1 hypothetical protein Sebd_094 [Sebdenia flabellata]
MKQNNNYIFHNILVLPLYKFNFLNSQASNLIPTKWKLILMSDGSFTQNLNSLTGKYITTNINPKFNDSLINQKKLRIIWLEDSDHNQLTFAKSLWTINNKNFSIQEKKPIGQLFIESQIDTYKEIHEIYYGYSKYLNRKFKSIQPIWGRKYTIYHSKYYLITIYEFFSPHLINFF